MSNQKNQPLPVGTKLQQYRIEKVISTGGFSIVYLGTNENGLPVAIKEFIPFSMQLRLDPTQIELHFKNNEDERRFQMGMRSFFKEAEAISRIDDRSVVRILNFFLANQTAYLVMPFEHGRTLQKLILREPYLFDDALLQKVFCDVLQGICIFHSNDILHLDLKPSNIWIRSDNSAMILDFGTTRIGKDYKSHTPPMLTPGFAAPEQHKKYYKNEHIGPWTDIYNLGATMYSCIEGSPPQDAESRMQEDRIYSLETRWSGQFSSKPLRLIDKMLRLNHLDRPQHAEQLLNSLSRYTPMPKTDILQSFFKNTFYQVESSDK